MSLHRFKLLPSESLRPTNLMAWHKKPVGLLPWRNIVVRAAVVKNTKQ